jgi:hypothetical protein
VEVSRIVMVCDKQEYVCRIEILIKVPKVSLRRKPAAIAEVDPKQSPCRA